MLLLSMLNIKTVVRKILFWSQKNKFKVGLFSFSMHLENILKISISVEKLYKILLPFKIMLKTDSIKCCFNWLFLTKLFFISYKW